MKTLLRAGQVLALLGCSVACLSCGSDDSIVIRFADPGAAGGRPGRGSFTLGVATAAAQIEEGNENADWWVYTQPIADGGLGVGQFVGEAVQGYARALDDVALVDEMNLDAYRLSVNWARMEPTRDNYDEAAFAHYDAVIDALVARGIKPMITVHHFSNPIWVDDPRLPECPPGGPTDENLCGFGHPTGGPAIVAEMAEFAGELARRYGDRVDEWVTVNEPINYLVASYMLTVFPPGRNLLFNGFEANFDRRRAHLHGGARGHVRRHPRERYGRRRRRRADCPGGLHAQRHRVGACGAQRGVGLRERRARPQHGALRLQPPVPLSRSVRARSTPTTTERRTSTHDDWAGKLDFMGVQYYSRQGVTGSPGFIPEMECHAMLRGLRLRCVRGPHLRRHALRAGHGL
jgi:hypothetical protein